MPLQLSGSFAGYGFSFLACRHQEQSDHGQDDREPVTENTVQVAISDRFTRIFEIAEGRRSAMLEAGWNPDAAQACAAMMFAAMTQTWSDPYS